MDHTSTSGTNCTKDNKWNSGYIGPGKSFSQKFNEEGSFDYFCIPHCLSGMKGKIIVKAKETPPKQSQQKGKEPVKKKDERVEAPKEISKPVTEFKSLDIINGVTTKTLKKGTLDFTIYHRFDNLIGTNGGPQVLFGLDNIRDIRLSFAYGLTNRITLGFGRSKGDWFNAPYQEVKNIYDGSIKYNLCSQDSGKIKFPVSISFYANTAITAMKSQDMPESEANFGHFSDRFSHSFQVILGHDFSRYLSVQLMPVYLRRNWVHICPGMRNDELDLFALGGGARWGFSDRIAIVAEYYYVFSDYRQNNKQYSNPMAVGFELNTGGHIFHINLSNATGIIPNTFIPYTTSSWLNKGFRLGFSISRKFVLNKKSSKTK